MSNREIAMNIVNTLTDEQIEAFITLFASENAQAMMRLKKLQMTRTENIITVLTR